MEQLQLWPPPIIPRVGALDQVGPLSRSLGHPPLGAIIAPVAKGAGVVPSRGEAAKGNASKGGTGSEHIGVRSKQHLGHHAAGGDTGDEDALGVGVVLVDCPLDHGDDTEGVAAAVVGEGFLGGDIPALVRVCLGGGGLGVDDDEAMLGGEGGVLGAGEGGGSGAVAPVGVDEDGWVGGEDVGDVDVEGVLDHYQHTAFVIGERRLTLRGLGPKFSVTSVSEAAEANEASRERTATVFILAMT